MATVHIGRLLGPVGFSRMVAIKRLHAQFARDPEFVTMFLDEARLAARIRHPNVVPTLDVVATHGELFLVMEYVHGESLAQLLRTVCAAGSRIPLNIVRTIVSGALHGLHAAHEAKSERGEPLGIVHRDVSPQNLLVGTDGIARILDFGVARAIGCAHVTRDQQVKGKLSYMAPEQVQNLRVDRRVDVYSAATVLWEMLTGRRLFFADTESIILARVLAGDVAPPSSLEPGVPPALDRVVMRGVDREPDSRYRTAREMALAIEDSGPLATASAVGEWVEATAAEKIAARSQHILEVEQINDLPAMAASSRPPALIVSSDPNETPTIVTANSPLNFESTKDRLEVVPSEAQESSGSVWLYTSRLVRGRPGGWRVPAIAGLGLSLLLFVIWIAARRQPTTSAAGGIRQSSASAMPMVPEPFVTSAPPVASAALAMSSPTPDSAAGGSPASAPAAASTSRKPSAPRLTGSLPPKSRRTNCNPPYTLDTEGHRHYKLECL
jgi:eukaryotic-like serine/threonine-protein kinase